MTGPNCSILNLQFSILNSHAVLVLSEPCYIGRLEIGNENWD